MDKEDALALLDVMRMQTVHEPPGMDGHLLALRSGCKKARRYFADRDGFILIRVSSSSAF